MKTYIYIYIAPHLYLSLFLPFVFTQMYLLIPSPVYHPHDWYFTCAYC